MKNRAQSQLSGFFMRRPGRQEVSDIRSLPLLLFIMPFPLLLSWLPHKKSSILFLQSAFFIPCSS
jgi:hypothetical protein